MAKPLTEHGPELVIASYKIEIDRGPVEIESWDEMLLDALENTLALDAADGETYASRCLGAIRYLRNGLSNQRVRADEAVRLRDLAQQAKRKVEQQMQRQRGFECEASDTLTKVREILGEWEWR